MRLRQRVIRYGAHGYSETELSYGAAWPGTLLRAPALSAASSSSAIASYSKAAAWAASTINQHLSAIRALADECAESDLLNQPTAAAIGRVKGVPVRGVRVGNWLTRDQAETLLIAPPNTLMGLRDRAILALLIGCGLRRDELVNLTFEHLQQREGRWVIVDIVGKGRRVRTVPVPGWAKALVDAWAFAADLNSGLVLRRFRKGGWLVYIVNEQGQAEAGGCRPTPSPTSSRRTPAPSAGTWRRTTCAAPLRSSPAAARRRSNRSSSPLATRTSRPPSAISAPSSTWPTRPATASAYGWSSSAPEGGGY
jgi:integrase